MTDHIERGVTAATKVTDTDQPQTLPHWYSEPELCATLMSICAQAVPADQAIGFNHQSRAPMAWTAGHLLHGSGFTEQVLALRKSNVSGRTITGRQIALSYPCTHAPMTFCGSKPEPTSQGAHQSTSDQQTAPLPLSARSLQQRLSDYVQVLKARDKLS